MLITETWGDVFTDFQIDNFCYFELNRTVYKRSSKRASGGIVIYIRESLIRPDANILVIKQDDDILWIKFDEHNSYFLDTMYLYLCYNVPSGSSRRGIIEDDLFDRLILH